MRFLVDACTGPSVARWLQEQGHIVFSVTEEAPEMEDIDIIRKAHDENWILITNDKDFGELVYRIRQRHLGVITMRLVNERSANKIMVLKRLIEMYAERLADQFVIVTDSRVRFARED